VAAFFVVSWVYSWPIECSCIAASSAIGYDEPLIRVVFHNSGLQSQGCEGRCLLVLVLVVGRWRWRWRSCWCTGLFLGSWRGYVVWALRHVCLAIMSSNHSGKVPSLMLLSNRCGDLTRGRWRELQLLLATSSLQRLAQTDSGCVGPARISIPGL
jgi:hypothetical protein